MKKLTPLATLLEPLRTPSQQLTQLTQQANLKMTSTQQTQQTQPWLVTKFAVYQQQRDALTQQQQVLEKELADALEDAKKGAWKFVTKKPVKSFTQKGQEQGQGHTQEPAQGQAQGHETARVKTARDGIASLQKKLTDFDSANTLLREAYSEFTLLETRSQEFDAWVAGCGQVAMPAHLREADEEEFNEFVKQCTVLKRVPLPKPFPTHDETPSTDKWEPTTIEWNLRNYETTSRVQQPVFEDPVVVEQRLKLEKKRAQFIQSIVARRADEKHERV